jgi:heme/copper-type cytochrome/quinol oxidase subunit 3
VSEPRHVTRSAAAWTAAGAGRISRERVAQPSGWWGMALFLCSEATLFGTLIATYFYLDFGSRSWPPPGVKPPSVALPLIATGVLVATIPAVWLAQRAARAGRRWNAVWLIVLAMVVQTCYLAAQILLFRHDLRQFTPAQSAYGSIYFTLLGAHHAHVLLGILLDLGVAAFVTVRGLTNYWVIAVRALALYWYVVAGLAVLVVFTQLSPSL